MRGTPAIGALQRQLQDHVLNGSSDVRPWIAGARGIAAEARLGVYFDAYRLRLIEVLENDFPGVRAWLGAEAFARLARAYIDAHPSTLPSVRWFGHDFAAFLATASPDRPLLSGLAEFEWIKGEVFDGPDAESVALADIGAVAAEDWPRMRFTLHPCVRQRRFASNLPGLWQGVTANRTVPAQTVAEPPADWLFWRRHLEVHWRSLETGEAGALRDAGDGADFAGICERLHAAGEGIGEDTAPLRAAGMLKRWITDGLIRAVDIAPAN
ncbi:MAG TPA: DNA-binding domain-containing protein [Rhodanobacteraceae bacterium]|nr:DNA-binding domain-containing protein [Rhodanobacteraceae bacterium]